MLVGTQTVLSAPGSIAYRRRNRDLRELVLPMQKLLEATGITLPHTHDVSEEQLIWFWEKTIPSVMRVLSEHCDGGFFRYKVGRMLVFDNNDLILFV